MRTWQTRGELLPVGGSDLISALYPARYRLSGPVTPNTGPAGGPGARGCEFFKVARLAVY